MLDVKEEQKFEELRRLTRLLHIPMPEAFWTLEVFDKHGELLQRYHTRSHSWTRNAYNMLFCQMAGKDADDVTFEAGKLSAKETDATLFTENIPLSISGAQTVAGTVDGYRGAAGQDGYGILVGSGENAESLEDYDLQTQIMEGTGAAQISHAQSEEHVITYAAQTLKAELVRYFNNNTGGGRNINEVGLVYKNTLAAATRRILQVRDKLGATVTVPDTGQCKVAYTIQLTYPS